MINDLVRLINIGVIKLTDIKDESIRAQVEYALNQSK